jgi:ABC-type lipoprotein release transport system permease subunit
VLVTGIDPAREWTINPFAKGLIEGHLIDGTSLRDAVVGKGLVEALQLKVGGKLVLMSQAGGEDLQSELVRVAGVLDTGLEEVDERAVYVSLEFAGLLGGKPGHLHEAAVVLADARLLPRVLSAVRGMLPPGVEARPWDEAMPDLASHIRVDLFSLRLIIGFIFLIVLIGTVNTLLMSVLERTREFGVMMALGVPTPFLTGMVLFEGALMGLLAAGVGTALGSAVTAALAHWGVDLTSLYGADRIEVSGIVFSGVMRARWSPVSMAVMAMTVGLLYPLAAVYPAWRVTRLRPVDTMR